MLAQKYLPMKSGQRILDVGCGTAELLKYLPDVQYVGMDSDRRYLDFAGRYYGTKSKFICADLLNFSWPVEGKFDWVVASGVLHHLSDQEMLHVLENVRKVLKPHASFVTIDGCYEQRQPLFAKLLLSMDRGKYVRKLEAYTALARCVFPQVRFHVERQLLRVPYSHLIMEMSIE